MLQGVAVTHKTLDRSMQPRMVSDDKASRSTELLRYKVRSAGRLPTVLGITFLREPFQGQRPSKGF